MSNGSPYAGKFLNLQPNFAYVCFYDGKIPVVEPTTGKLMGKVIDIDSKKTYYVPNLTDALLLYLLCRESDDFIPYETFKQLITTKFAGVTPSQIDDVLDWIAGQKALDTTGTSSNATKDPDPLGLFTGDKINWNSQKPTPAKKLKDFKGKHGHSEGYLILTVWR
jgi:hypothetical protein